MHKHIKLSLDNKKKLKSPKYIIADIRKEIIQRLQFTETRRPIKQYTVTKPKIISKRINFILLLKYNVTNLKR